MASLRSFAETGSDWHGCGRDSFDAIGLRTDQRLALRKFADGSRKLLARTIEAEIIPRLMLAHRPLAPGAPVPRAERGEPVTNEVVEFVRLLLAHDVAVASAYIEAQCQQGVALEGIFLDLMAPAARLLGELWQEDICDFTDVTIALSRLQQLLRELGPAFEDGVVARPCGRSALLVAAPGDQHTFGIFVVQEFFRRAGWKVRGGYVGTSDELGDLVASERFDVVGLSVSNGAPTSDMAALIKTIRQAALGALSVMVGGRFFLDHPDYVRRVGADATAQDGRQAVLGLSNLLRTNVLR